MRKLTLVLVCLSIVSCNSKINWPKVLQCGAPVVDAELHEVERILAGSGDASSELATLAEQYAPSTVECAVQEVVTDLSARMGAARDDHALGRGRAFLAEVQK